MAITLLEQNTVNKALALAKRVLDLKADLDSLNVIYDAAGGVKSTLDDTKLASVPSFQGITKAQLDDGAYALTATLKGNIATAYAQLAQLAARV